MSKASSNKEQLRYARRLLMQATSVEELRQAQSVVLPLEFGLTLEQTARAIGLSEPVTRLLRKSFFEGDIAGAGNDVFDRMRRRVRLTFEEEHELVAPILERSYEGGPLDVALLREHIEKARGKPVALSTIYNILHRHGWGGKRLRYTRGMPDQRMPETKPSASVTQ
jgi:transposase